jgi:hypothetical protein
MLLHQEDVAMTVETKSDLSQIATAKWTDSCRPGESRGWDSQPEPPPEMNEELAFPAGSPPVSWPRVFPGL